MILSAWKELMQDLLNCVSFMPRDVAMQWNSTWDVLDYALKHRKVVDAVTQRRLEAEEVRVGGR